MVTFSAGPSTAPQYMWPVAQLKIFAMQFCFFFVSVSVLGWFRHFLQISETSARSCYPGVKKRQRDA